MLRKPLIVAAAVFSFVGLAVAGYIEKPSVEETHEKYCTGVETWIAQGEAGKEKISRAGHPDWRGIAEEYCPLIDPDDLDI